MPPDFAVVEAWLDDIEREMRRIGMWQAEEPEAAKAEIKTAFGADAMSFEQWLQFVFIPNVRQIIAEKGQFPDGSDVGVAAIRNFDGLDRASDLVSLLCRFDCLFDEP